MIRSKIDRKQVVSKFCVLHLFRVMVGREVDRLDFFVGAYVGGFGHPPEEIVQ